MENRSVNSSAKIMVTNVPVREPAEAASVRRSKPKTSEIITIVKNAVIIRPMTTGCIPFKQPGIKIFQIVKMVIMKLKIERIPVFPATAIKKTKKARSKIPSISNL